MPTQTSESIDSAAPLLLFDVVISMPLGARLETIQKLAQTQSGLSPERIERLIAVLSSTPNAKVGSGLSQERAEEEKSRFLKAGLLVEVLPSLAWQTSTTGLTEFEKNTPASKPSFFSGKVAVIFSSTAAVVLGLLYAGEAGFSVGGRSLPWGQKAMVSGRLIGQSASPDQPSTAAATDGAVSSGARSGDDATGDADLDDPLILAVTGKKLDGKGLTLDQAIAASKLAARNTAGGGPAEAASLGVVTQQTKQLLAAEFAALLSELGQTARARQVIKAVAGGETSPVTDAPTAALVQAAQIKLQAWSAVRVNDIQARQIATELKTKTQSVTGAPERAQLQGHVAVILSRHPLLLNDAPRPFLAMAAESLKAVTGAQTSVSVGDLAVSMAEVSLQETTARAKAGAWAKAKSSAAQGEELLKQATDPWAKVRLLALDYQVKLQTGQPDKAAKSLESALMLVGKNTSLSERAMWLRSIAQLSEAATQEQFEATAAALQSQLSAKSGIEKARGLTELSLLYTAAGLPGKSAQMRGQALATSDLSPADSLSIYTDLIVRNDMAMAKMLHGLGRYADAEALLQRVAGYLF